MITMTKQEAREYLVQYQMINTKQYSGLEAIKKVFQRIHTIQIDPLDVVGRNADLVLQARIKQYYRDDIDCYRYVDKYIMDGWDKMMAMFPVSEFSFFEPVRTQRAKDHLRTLQYRNQEDALKMVDKVYQMIQEEGPKYSTEISIGTTNKSRWGASTVASAALDYLYLKGDLVVSNRNGAQKQYDVTERMYPSTKNQPNAYPDMSFPKAYLYRRIESIGLVTNKSGVHFTGPYISNKKTRTTLLEQLIEEQHITPIQIEGCKNIYYAPTKALDHRDPVIDRITFIAPLDNLIWDRDLLEEIFDFHYRWEVYTPKTKREYGYYVLPIIRKSTFIGRIEFEKHRKDDAVTIKQIWWEPHVKKSNIRDQKLNEAIKRFEMYLKKK